MQFIVRSYANVGYIFILLTSMGSIVQGLVGGQVVRPPHRDHLEFAGNEKKKLEQNRKFEQHFRHYLTVSDILMINCIIIKV